MSDMLARLMALAAMKSRGDYYTKAETDRHISDEVARIVSDAPEDFDTLRELSDWIATHEESAAAMNSAIQANTAGVAALYAEVATKAPQSTTYTKTEVDTALAAKLNTADVDTTLSSTSTNPVQNKVVQGPIARLVDAGAKNLMDLQHPTAFNRMTVAGAENGSVIATCSNATWANSGYEYELTVGKAYKFVIFVDSASVSSVQFQCFVNDVSGESVQELGRTQRITDIGVFSIDFIATAKIRVGINLNNSNTVATGSATYRAMLCTVGDYTISPEFVPYAPSNRELYEEIEKKADILPADRRVTDLNTAVDPGVYRFYGSGGTENVPSDMAGTSQFGMLEVFAIETYRKQVLTHFESSATPVPPVVYIRRSVDSGATWSPWGKFVGTAVT